jgi:DNA-binding NarL/FixJ family response regulator
VPKIAVLVVSGLRDRGRNLELQLMGAVVMDKDALAEHLPRAVAAARCRLALRSAGPAAIVMNEHPETRPTPDPFDFHEPAASSSDSARVARYAAEHRLTEREHEVFTLSFQGLTDKEIARALRVSHSTVRAHWHRIAAKMGCEGQRDVMRQFARCLLRALTLAERERAARDRTESPADVNVSSREGDKEECHSRPSDRAI